MAERIKVKRDNFLSIASNGSREGGDTETILGRLRSKDRLHVKFEMRRKEQEAKEEQERREMLMRIKEEKKQIPLKEVRDRL